MKTTAIKAGREYAALPRPRVDWEGCYARVEVIRPDHPTPVYHLASSCVQVRLLEAPTHPSVLDRLAHQEQPDGTYLLEPRMIRSLWSEHLEERERKRLASERYRAEKKLLRQERERLRELLQESGLEETLSLSSQGLLIPFPLAARTLDLLREHGLEEEASALNELLSADEPGSPPQSESLG